MGKGEEGYLTENGRKKCRRKRGVKESGRGQREEYEGPRRRLLCSSLLLKQSRHKYFRAKSGVPRSPLDA